MRSKLFACLFIMGFLYTALPATCKAIKIGVVDMGALYRRYKEVSKSQAYIKEKKDEYQGVIDKEKYSLKEEELALETLKEDLRANRAKYSADELKKKENEQRRLVTAWQKKFQSMKTKFEKYKTELEDIEKKEFDNIRTKINGAIAAVARRMGLDLVQEKQWIYYGNTTDVTDQVLRQLER